MLKLLDGNVVDSSPMYGAPRSVAGDLIAELGMRERLFIATKVWTQRPRGRHRADGDVLQAACASKAMDLMQVHNLVDVATHTRTLQEWKSKAASATSASRTTPPRPTPRSSAWLKTGTYDFLQINYSLAEREAEKRLLPLARERRSR